VPQRFWPHPQPRTDDPRGFRAVVAAVLGGIFAKPPKSRQDGGLHRGSFSSCRFSLLRVFVSLRCNPSISSLRAKIFEPRSPRSSTKWRRGASTVIFEGSGKERTQRRRGAEKQRRSCAERLNRIVFSVSLRLCVHPLHLKKRFALVLGSCPFVLLRAFVSLPSFGCGYAASGNPRSSSISIVVHLCGSMLTGSQLSARLGVVALLPQSPTFEG
jgi:hypothetical protein